MKVHQGDTYQNWQWTCLSLVGLSKSLAPLLAISIHRVFQGCGRCREIILCMRDAVMNACFVESHCDPWQSLEIIPFHSDPSKSNLFRSPSLKISFATISLFHL